MQTVTFKLWAAHVFPSKARPGGILHTSMPLLTGAYLSLPLPNNEIQRPTSKLFSPSKTQSGQKSPDLECGRGQGFASSGVPWGS